MQKITFFKKIFAVVFLMFCFSSLELESSASVIPKIKKSVETKKTQVKSIRCNNCPCNCLIKPNQTGECGQYKNVDGKLVPVKK